MAQITNEILHKCSAAQFIGKIDLFTDTAAILNLFRFKEYYRMARGHSVSIYLRFSGKERTSLYISREKGNHYYIQTRHNNLFLRKLNEKLALQAHVNTKEKDYRIVLMPLGHI